MLVGYAPSGPSLYRGIQGSSSGCSPCPACLHSWASGSSTSHYPSLRRTPTVPRAKLRSQTVLARGCSRHCPSHSPHRGFPRALSSLSCHAVDGLLAPRYCLQYQVCNTPLSRGECERCVTISRYIFLYINRAAALRQQGEHHICVVMRHLLNMSA